MSDDPLSHFDAQGRAHMVDVGAKPPADREAVALGSLRLHPDTLARITQGTAAKGDVLGVARVAGIQGAKRTADLIPLCHPLPLTHLAVEFAPDPDNARLWIRATARTTGPTGVEMEALTAVAAAALTVYDMCKAMDRAIVIGSTFLLHKRGGRSGPWTHPDLEHLQPPAHVAWR